MGAWLPGAVRLLSLSGPQGATMGPLAQICCPEASVPAPPTGAAPPLTGSVGSVPPNLPHTPLQPSPRSRCLHRWQEIEPGAEGGAAAPDPLGSTHISTNQRENSEHLRDLIGIRKTVVKG